MRRVVQLAAEKAGWGKRNLGKGSGMGIAVHRSFLTYVATVVEVEVDDKGEVKIPSVHTAVDAGIVVNPEATRAQFEGAAVFGTSIVRSGAITARNGVIEQSNFNDYPVARMNEAPYKTTVHIVDSDAPPAGVGEPGVPPFAPALCNAIFAATESAFANCRSPKIPLSRSESVWRPSTTKGTKVHEGNSGKQSLRDTSCPLCFMLLLCLVTKLTHYPWPA